LYRVFYLEWRIIAMRFERYADTDSFAADVRELLMENEVQNNLPLSFMEKLRVYAAPLPEQGLRRRLRGGAVKAAVGQRPQVLRPVCGCGKSNLQRHLPEDWISRRLYLRQAAF
jgi:hypothetical protein